MKAQLMTYWHTWGTSGPAVDLHASQGHTGASPWILALVALWILGCAAVIALGHRR